MRLTWRQRKSLWTRDSCGPRKSLFQFGITHWSLLLSLNHDDLNRPVKVFGKTFDASGLPPLSLPDPDKSDDMDGLLPDSPLDRTEFYKRQFIRALPVSPSKKPIVASTASPFRHPRGSFQQDSRQKMDYPESSRVEMAARQSRPAPVMRSQSQWGPPRMSASSREQSNPMPHRRYSQPSQSLLRDRQSRYIKLEWLKLSVNLIQS